MSANNDSEWVERVRNGDAEAYARLVRKYESPLLGFIFNYLKDGQAAQDLAQEVFVKGYTSIRTYENRNQAAFSTWLFAIARNACIDELRKSIRRREDPLEDFHPHMSAQASQAEDLTNKRFHAELESGLMSLSLKYREAFDLTYVQGFSYVDSAVVLKSNVYTIRSRAEKARSVLEKKMRRFKEWSES